MVVNIFGRKYRKHDEVMNNIKSLRPVALGIFAIECFSHKIQMLKSLLSNHGAGIEFWSLLFGLVKKYKYEVGGSYIPVTLKTG